MQIFQTTSSTRWNRFKWIGGFVLLAVFVSATVLIVALQQVYTPALPRLNDHVTQLTKWQPDEPTPFPAKQLAPGFQKYISQKEKKGVIAGTTPCDKPVAVEGGGVGPLPLQGEVGRGFGIRSAFYVAWDPQSFF